MMNRLLSILLTGAVVLGLCASASAENVWTKQTTVTTYQSGPTTTYTSAPAGWACENGVCRQISNTNHWAPNSACADGKCPLGGNCTNCPACAACANNGGACNSGSCGTAGHSHGSYSGGGGGGYGAFGNRSRPFMGRGPVRRFFGNGGFFRRGGGGGNGGGCSSCN